jgi:hypothetical protein
MKRKLLVILTGISGAAAGCALLQPINSTLLRLLAIGSLGLFILCILVLGWKTKWLRFSILSICAVAFLVLLLPGRTPDTTALRDRYVKSLDTYSDVSYVWGGEGKWGIDCSGLPRTAFRDALFSEGLRTLNGTLIREGVRQWWFDASAKALSEGHKGYLIPLFPTEALRKTDFSKLKPSDIAITRSGIHCLVYVGDDTWIQADPAVGKVATFNARTTENTWFDEPVKLYHWSPLE